MGQSFHPIHRFPGFECLNMYSPALSAKFLSSSSISAWGELQIFLDLEWVWHGLGSEGVEISSSWSLHGQGAGLVQVFFKIIQDTTQTQFSVFFFSPSHLLKSFKNPQQINTHVSSWDRKTKPKLCNLLTDSSRS